MIQRIQTFYLLVIFVLSTITFFSNLGGLHNQETGELYTLSYSGLFEKGPSNDLIFSSSVWLLTALMMIIPIISFIAVFLFKRRMLQIRLLIFNLVLMAGFYGLLFIYLWQFGKSTNTNMYLEMVTAFPLVNIILSVLAIRAIGKDEALVKSLNRIR
jgi:hypothetical protein